MSTNFLSQIYATVKGLGWVAHQISFRIKMYYHHPLQHLAVLFLLFDQVVGINLIRNPLSARNPGASHCQFETPPPSAVRCCLAMFLEPNVRDCLSTCQAPAISPAVNNCSGSLSTCYHLFLCHHHEALNTQSPSFHCAQWLSDPNYDTHHSGSLHWQPHVASWRMQAIAWAHPSHGCSLNAEGPLIWLACAFQQSQRPLHVHIGVMGAAWMQKPM